MAKGKRRPIKFFDDANTTTIVLKHKDTEVPVLGRMIEMEGGATALWLMEGFFHMEPGKNFKPADKFEDPGAALRATVSKLKSDPDFAGMNDDQIAKLAQRFGLVGKRAAKGSGMSMDGAKKVKKEVGQKWKHNDTGDVVTLTGKEGTSWLGKTKKGDVKISGMTWNKYALEK